VEMAVPGDCDLACGWCNFQQIPASERRSCAELDAQLRHLSRQGRREIIFGFRSSEPTTYEGFLPLVSRARKLGFRNIVLSTSGLRLADASYVRELKARGITRVRLSFPG